MRKSVARRKKFGLRTKWRPIQKDTQGGNMSEQTIQHCNKQTQNIHKGFTQVLKKSDQILHCYVVQLNTHKKFFLTIVYGMNHNHQRHSMWEDLLDLSHQMQGAWYILGDFNAILYKEDRREGDVTYDKEIKEMLDFMEIEDLQEMRWNRAYYSWTNKTIWSRIDRALINIHWLQFCEMWRRNQDFNKIIDSVVSPLSNSPPRQLSLVMAKLRSQLSKLNRDKFADLRAHEEREKKDLTNI
ncbi:hypothetical protein Cgig2_021609 [Carnegiea gigantea]|uniref:Reverse transcriptase n=1 Tax=Carnegiea gigantea TaxID=171969 RepID=A0A9Q1JJR6_9CARY|nr:hypothetical protein Cgig2_021609 [Carnegiea gigantea]